MIKIPNQNKARKKNKGTDFKKYKIQQEVDVKSDISVIALNVKGPGVSAKRQRSSYWILKNECL